MKDKEKLKAAIKKKDGWWATLFSGPAANFFLQFICDIHSITPNCVTSTSLCICIIACAFISNGNHIFLIVGGLLIQLAFIVDCLDGQLARYRKQCSNFGAWYDRVTDRVKDFLIYFSIGYACFKLYGDWRVWPLCMISFFFIFLFDYYVNMDVKLEPLVKLNNNENQKISNKKNILSLLFSFGSFVYKSFPILQFHIGEQYLIISLFLIFNKPLWLLYFVSVLGAFYSIYWPLSKYYGKKPEG